MEAEALLEQVDYVIEELSKSTNQKHAKERREILTGLRVARDVVEFDPCELPELKTGERRLRFTWAELMAFVSSGEWNQILDTNDTSIMLGMDGLYAAPKARKRF